jgi:hypothetical protein
LAALEEGGAATSAEHLEAKLLSDHERQRLLQRLEQREKEADEAAGRLTQWRAEQTFRYPPFYTFTVVVSLSIAIVNCQSISFDYRFEKLKAEADEKGSLSMTIQRFPLFFLFFRSNLLNSDFEQKKPNARWNVSLKTLNDD